MFSCAFSKISKNAFFTEHLYTAASEILPSSDYLLQTDSQDRISTSLSVFRDLYIKYVGRGPEGFCGSHEIL